MSKSNRIHPEMKQTAPLLLPVDQLERVSIWIPSYHRRHMATRAIRGVWHRSEADKDTEIHVLGSEGYRVSKFPGNTILYPEQGVGWNQGRAYARVVELALDDPRWEYLLIVEDDCRILPYCLAELVQHMDSYRFKSHYAAKPQGIDIAIPTGKYFALLGKKAKARKVQGNYSPISLAASVVTTFGAVMIRRSVFEAVGNFQKFTYRPICDFIGRAELMGFRFAYIPRARVQHDTQSEGGVVHQFRSNGLDTITYRQLLFDILRKEYGRVWGAVDERGDTGMNKTVRGKLCDEVSKTYLIPMIRYHQLRKLSEVDPDQAKAIAKALIGRLSCITPPPRCRFNRRGDLE